MMPRVFASRYTGDLKPGDGAKISWQPGETVLVIAGQDAGRTFTVLTEGRLHPDAPPGQLVREGYFTDDPERTRWAKQESQLWFALPRAVSAASPS